LLLAKDGHVVGDDVDKVTFDRLGTYTDTTTGKPVANVTRYTYTDAEDTYVVTFTRHRDLAATKMIDQLDGIKKAAARLGASGRRPRPGRRSWQRRSSSSLSAGSTR